MLNKNFWLADNFISSLILGKIELKKYYLDACIWRDFHENREDKLRPLGEWTFEMFRMIKENLSLVLYSDLTVDELSKDYNPEQIKKYVQDYNRSRASAKS